MKKKLSLIIFFIFSYNSYCWDFGGKLDTQITNTDNANLSETSPVKDNLTMFRGYLQVKNEKYKIKLKAKNEKYNSQNANDNYLADLSLQYRHSDNDDYTFGVFKQAYNGSSIVSTDTTSDNAGFRLGADFSKSYKDDNSGYLSFKASQKKYSRITGRTDRIFSGAVGVEHYLFSNLMINPDFSVLKNNSTLSYYRNLSFGPYLLISFNPYDSWEIFADGSYTKTNYSGRTIPNDPSINETQSLVIFDIGTVYKMTKKLSLQVTYSTAKNSSNNPITAYKNNTVALGITLKF